MVNHFRQLRPASLRGVSFEVDSDDNGFGRRIVTHQFPGRDEPGHEDLGADVSTFSIEAVIIGSNFIARADALEAALRQPGPASLIHPHYGERTVIVKSANRRHSSRAAGEVIFSITMERYGTVKFPTAASNTAAGLVSSSQGGFAAALSEFNTFFRSGGLPDFVTQDAINRNGSFMEGLNGLLNTAGILQAVPVLDVLSGDFAQNAIAFYQNLITLVAPARKPVIGSASTAVPIPARNLVTALMGAADQTLVDTLPATTANRSARSQNAQSLDFLHRLSSLTAGVGSVRHIAFESREEAVGMRDGLADRLSTLRDELGTAGWDQSWRSAGSMMAALNRDINEQIGRLPKTVRVRPASVRSSLALANRLYGDNPEVLIDRAGDITRRNAVRHPGFVPAENLEVLIDVS